MTYLLKHVRPCLTRSLQIGLTLAIWQLAASLHANDAKLRPVRLQSRVTTVQPMTGIVLWNTNEHADTAPIQLEYAYLTYRQIVKERGVYDWEPVEQLLSEISSRKHQAIIRWHDTYVGRAAGVPEYIRKLDGWAETTALSEGQPTGFPDWSNADWQDFVLEFFSQFAERYDRDVRLAFVQVGFGLWAEYHIYDGPMIPGRTFPTKEFQRRFVRHLSAQFQQTPWMISVDAAGTHAPFRDQPDLLAEVGFGLFDDSLNHRRHAEENEPNWRILGLDRWQTSPAGGEFSFFHIRDQRDALGPRGPYGIPFARQAARFHLSFVLGDDQPRYRSAEVIRDAGMKCGYRFRVSRFLASQEAAEVTIENTGIAPIYYDAWPAVGGQRSMTSLRGLLPGESREFRIAAAGASPVLTIECDRLVPGQRIEYDANLP